MRTSYTLTNSDRINIRCRTHGNQIGFVNDQALLCPECFTVNGEFKPMKTPEKRFITNMVLTLTFEDRVIMQIDAWYLLLSAILRSGPPFFLNQTLQEAVLTARVEIGGEQFVFQVPQPIEFKDDG